MVKLFAKGTTTFSGNGKAVLTPTVCTVSEVAGGGYELHMEHPFDPEGRYLLLEDEEIIVAPVPPFHRDAITLPEMTIYIVNEDGTPVYSSLPRTTTDESKVDQIRKVKAAPGDYAWAPGTNYNVGALVTYGGRIYRAKQYNFAVTPGTANQVWGYVTTVAGTYTGDVTTIPGTVVETLPLNAQVFFLADYSQKYIRVRTVQGNEGYIAREKVTVTQDKQSGQVIPEKDITEQAFRIYSVTCEEELGSVVVEARHISYDFAGNALYKCELKQADPATAISMLRGTLMEPDNRVIACDIVTDQKITQDWSFRNPVNALLGQDDGLVPLLDAKLLRDNGDFYILDNSNPRQGITLAYGRNLTGVQWNRNTENVITRLVPRCNLSNGGFLYVDGIFVDSERISDYPVHRIEVMDCGYTIGQKYTPPEGGDDVVWTEETAKAQMLKDARERFTKQHVDSVAVSLTVEFLLLGDTEEFRQYRGLQRVNLYDEIAVITGPSGMKSTAQVTEYEYDCILQRYNSIRVGRVNTFRRVPGFTLTSGSVTYSKLSPELVSLISGGTSTTGSSDDDSQADQPNGGAVLPPMTPVIDDLTHTDTDKALSANMGRALDEGKKDKQEPVTDPTASGSGVQFISGISQNEQGVITPVKKTVRTMGGASSSADGSSGLVPKPEAGEEEKFLRGDGEWASPAGTYSLPLAADGTRGGVQIGYSQNGKNYPVQLSGEKMFVNVPWTDHYAWDDITGKPETATRWAKWSEVTSKPIFSGGTTTLAWGTTHTIANVGGNEVKLTMPANPNTDHYAWSDITGKPATATRWPSWSEVTDKPTSFYTLPLAASGTRGGVKIGYTASDKKYPVQLDSNERAYVEVPWTDNDHQYSAGTGLQLTDSGAFRIYLPRVNENANALPEGNAVRIREYQQGDANLPTGDAWYHVFELRSQDTKYGTQIAFGMTQDRAYYRKYAGSTWGSWHSLINTDTWRGIQNNLTSDSTSDSLSAAQGKALATGSARDSTKLPLAGGTMTGKISSYEDRILQWTTNDNDNNSFGTSWYGIGRYTPQGDHQWLSIANYWGINLITGRGDNLTHNGNVILSAGNYDSYAAKRVEAVKNITRSGTTFTVTRCDGTTFTFTQQDTDTNTWRPVQNNLTSDSTTDSLSAYQGQMLSKGYARDNRVGYFNLAPGDSHTCEMKNSNGAFVIFWRVGTANSYGIKIGVGTNIVNMQSAGTDNCSVSVNNGTVRITNSHASSNLRGFILANNYPGVATGD